MATAELHHVPMTLPTNRRSRRSRTVPMGRVLRADRSSAPISTVLCPPHDGAATMLAEPGSDMRPGATIADLYRSLGGPAEWSDMLAWPPDVFAFTPTVLEASDAQRLLVAPLHGAVWPPPSDE